MAETRFHMSTEPCAIVQLDCWSAAFETGLSHQLGGALPAACGETAVLCRWLAIRIAPRRIWLVGDGTSTPPPIDTELGCSVSLGESRVRLRLGGTHIFDVLGACVAVDWDAPHSAPGRAVQTGFHHVPVLLLRRAANACDLLAPRSFARSLADWVADAAAPYRLETAE